jgi:hypothetical protein
MERRVAESFKSILSLTVAAFLLSVNVLVDGSEKLVEHVVLSKIAEFLGDNGAQGIRG